MADRASLLDAFLVRAGVGGAAQVVHARIGQREAIALRHLKDQFGLERAFDVDMQFGLGHAAKQFGQAVDGEVL